MRKSTWLNTARIARVGPIDARAFLLLPVLMIHMRPGTLFLFLFVLIVFTVVDFVLGHRFPTALTMLRLRIAGLGRSKLTIAAPQPRRGRNL